MAGVRGARHTRTKNYDEILSLKMPKTNEDVYNKQEILQQIF